MMSSYTRSGIRGLAVVVGFLGAAWVLAGDGNVESNSAPQAGEQRVQLASINVSPSGFAASRTSPAPLKDFAALRLADTSTRYRNSSLYANCSAAPDAVLLEPLCGLYYQLLESFYDRNSNLLALEDQLWTWRLERREIEFSQLEVMDVLALDMTKVSLYSIHDSRLREIGVSQKTLRAMPTLNQLKESLEQVLVSVPENLDSLPQTMVLAVWGDAQHQQQPLAVLVRATPHAEYPIAVRW